MECPHCHRAVPLPLCPTCGKETPEGSRYCSQCGVLIEKVAAKSVEAENDFSERKLCSDGTCIGIINEKGVCNICGRPYSGPI